MELRKENVTRYVLPLREGGSLPALAEADDGFKYVLKFRGAGHGPKMLIAELVGALVARQLGFRVPELVLLNVDEDFGRTEGDEEIQDLLKTSRGLNLGLHYLSGAFTVDPYVNRLSPDEAANLVWLDAFLTNVDRTFKNPNMLMWHGELWLIDHGASLMFHHAWTDPAVAARSPFVYIKDHAMLRFASDIRHADRRMRQLITPRTLGKIVDLIPREWLEWEGSDETPEQIRGKYKVFLTERLANSSIFVNQAEDARRSLV